MEELSALSGVGRKSAQRSTFHIISIPTERAASPTDIIHSVWQNVCYCGECFVLTDEELCPICRSAKCNHRQTMVVENVRDLAAYEKTGKYEDVYHVLYGAISPMLGIGSSDIKLRELMRRLESDVEEVIIATNPSLEGGTAAMYIVKLVKPTDIKVPRTTSRVSAGGDLEYIGEVTLPCTLEGGTGL